MTALLFVASGEASADEDAEALRDGLASFASSIGQLVDPAQYQDPDNLGQLAEALPLSDAHPLRDLDLDDLLQQALERSGAALDSVDAYVDALDGSTVDAGGIEIDVAATSVPAGTGRDITITLTSDPATAYREVPLTLPTDAVDVTGGVLRLGVDLQTTLDLHFEPGATDPLLGLYLTSPPTLDLDVVVSTPSPVSVEADLGFTRVTVGAEIDTATAGYSLALVSPHPSGSPDAGRITAYDWTNTALEDLVTLTRSGSVAAELTLDSDLLTAASPDATLAVTDTDLSDGFSPAFGTSPGVASLKAALSSSDLLDFTNVSPSQVLTGVGQVAAAIQALQTSADVPLPFLKGGVGRSLDLVAGLVAALQQQTVVCGTTQTSPPTGALVGLAAGDSVFCQATTTDTVKPGSVTWTAVPGTGTVHANGTADGTVAAVPTALVEVKVVTAGVPPLVTVAYKDADDVIKGASQPVPTAQSLLTLLEEQAGFDEAGTSVAYDPASTALTFTLRRTVADGAAAPVALDFADRFEAASGLVGLSPGSGATATVKATGAVVELTLGVLLAPQDDVPEAVPADDPDTDSTFLDRFFVQAGPGGRVLSVEDLEVLSTVALKGRLGFLDVTATGDLAVAKTSGADHVLTLSLTGTGPLSAGGTALADAVQLTKLLNALPTHVSAPVLAVSGSGSLEVTAKVNEVTLATGGVDFALGPITGLADLTDPAKLTVTPRADFNDDLKKFYDLAQDDPMALLTLILDGLTELAESTQGVAALDTQLPFVGASPRDLLLQIQRVRLAVEEMRGAPSATITCRNTTVVPDPGPQRDVITAITDDTIACRAENLSEATQVEWTVVGGTPVSGATETATIGPAPGTEFTFTVGSNPGLASPENEDGFQVGVAWRDADGDHTAQLPSLGAPPTLEALNDALVRKLGLPEDALGLTLVDATPPGGSGPVKTLRLTLGYGICTQGNTALPACSSTAAGTQVPKLQAPLNVELGDLGDGVPYGLSTEGDIALEYDANAVLDLGIPLTTTPTPFVFGATGASVTAGVAATGLGLDANIGPLGVKLGTLAGGDGILKMAGGLSVVSGHGANDPISFSAFASGLDVNLVDGLEQDCGTGNYDGDGDPDTGSDPVTGQVCAKLALKAVLGATEVDLGDLGLSLTSFSDPSTIAVRHDPELLQKLQDAVLSVEFLLRALPPLLDQLEVSLRSGGAGGQKLPIIGGALDAGADVVDKLNSFVTPAANGLADAVAAVDTAGEMEDAIQGHLFGIVGPGGVDLLLDNDGVSGITADDVTMELTCGAAECLPGADSTDIDDIRLTFAIGQGITPSGTVAQGCTVGVDGCVATGALPFDIGLDGLPLRISGALDGSVMWRVKLDFGLSRNEGPYLGVNHTSSGQPVNDVEVGARVTLGDRSDACTGEDAAYRAGVSAANGYSDTRCLSGTLGFLNVNLRDKSLDADRTGISLTAGLRLTSASVGDNGKLKLTEILGGALGADFGVAANAQVNLLFRAGIGDLSGADIGFPAVLGTFAASWSYTAGSGAEQGAGTPTIAFDDIYLDGGAFMSKYLQPIAQQVRSVTSPLKPVIDTLQTPIPVVSDLAALVGEPPVTLIGLAEAIGGNDLSMVKSVIAFIQFANDFPPGQSLLIPLKASNPASPGSGVMAGEGGSFSIAAANAVTPKTPNDAGSLIQNPEAGSNLGGALAGRSGKPGGASTALPDGRYSTFGVPGLDIPLLRDPAKVFSVLMGQDVTLVEYEFGGLRATAGFSYSFGPFMVGPVPVVITIGGGVEITGHFALGYDTSGLRAIFGGAGPEAVLNGLYLRDFDRNGQDVPEIKLAGTVYAGAAVSIAIVTAGVEAGITLTVGLDLDDRPNNDGKLNFDEVVNRLPNPICLFTVEGSLDAFLRAFVKFDFFVASKRFDFTIVEVHLLDFSAGCSPPKPQPASVDPTDSGTLLLNIGNRANIRAVNVGQIDEKVVVRPLERGGFSVEIFGAYEEYPGTFDTIIGRGEDGKDEILLASGVRTTGTVDGKTCAAETPCELPWPSDVRAELYGGDKNDSLTGGTGNDTIHGEGGNDKLAGGGGIDELKGGDGNDTIDGGTGNDTIHGGTGTGASESGDGPDNLQGGPGEDYVYGGSGDDLIAGGPGVQPGTGVAAASLDGIDRLYGGSGADSIAGHEGDDTIFGDEVLSVSCTDAGAGPAGDDVTNDDRIEGGPGIDTIVAGSGDDTVKGNEDGDILCGNGGNDTIDGDEATGPAGGDTVRGGPGNDILNGHKGEDVVDGGSGNDQVLGGLGHDAVLGGTGRDRVEGGDGNDLVVGEDGTLAAGVPGSLGGASAAANGAKVSSIDDTTDSTEARADCATAYDVEVTTAGNGDCVIGGLGDDAVLGGGGPDNLLGDDGADWLDGGSGGDLIRGGLLDDIAYGRAGADEIFGDSGDDDLYGGADRDTIRGGTGVDEIEGNEAADTLYGDEGDDRMIGGSSTAGTPDADDVGTGRGDVMHGLAGDDVLVGDNGTITGTPAVVTVFDVDAGEVGGRDTVFGGEGDDRLYGGNAADELRADNGADTAEGNGGEDLVLGGDGDDRLQGGSSPESSGAGFSQPDVRDEVHGGAGADVILGDNGTIAASGLTTMTGAATPAASFGDDDLFGEAGDDRIYGQQGADDLDGGGDADYLVGDLGSIGSLGTPAVWPGGAPNRPVLLIAQSVGGVDTIIGGAGDDHGYGGAAGDVIDGNAGDDYLEGNGGQDTLRGGTGEDDLVGGSSTATVPGTAHDEGEVVVEGGDGVDVIAGDNADITRIVATPTTWEQDPITGGAARTVVLRYRDETTCGTKCGADLLRGDADNDQVFGQGDNDVIEGGTGDDYLEGNQATDDVRGEDGEDDILGGSADVASGTGTNRVGRPDAADVLSGGNGADLITGDNAIVTRIAPFAALTDRTGMSERRHLTLLDLGSSTAGTFGGDTITGGAGVDVLLGQSGSDVLKGDAGDDYLEGGQDADLVEGNAGGDDLVGGSHVELAVDGDDAETATGQPDVADQLFGGDGSDLLLGDNAQVLRSDAHGYPFSPLTGRRDMTPRTLRLLDLGPAGTGAGRTWPDVVAGSSGADSLSGGAGVDVALGQDGADWISGGPGDDYAEGNGNESGTQDRLYGDQLLDTVTGAPATPAEASAAAELQGPPGADGQDDLIGGSSNIDATQATAVGRDGFRDGSDLIVGNGASDFELGDNGTLVREAGDGDDKRYVERYPIPYTVPAEGDPRAYVRHAVRLDVPAAGDPTPAFSAGDDVMQGNGGDDFMWGQSGDDQMRGGDGDDDLLGELGNDEIFGDAGQDAVIGDRGGIISRFIDGSDGDPSQQSFSQNAPPAETFVAFRPGTLDRRVHLQRDVAAHTGLTGSVDAFAATGMRSRGEDVGGVDHIRGGPDHDSLHGAAGDDLINGDSGGDYVFGSNGSDVLWGGRGCDPVADTPDVSPDCYAGAFFDASSRGFDDRFVDHLLGGYGGLDSKNDGVPELLDFRPRGSLDTPGVTCSTGTGPTSAGGLATVDPCSWLRMTDIGTGALPQHYQGTDWLYGGYDRDVLEGNVTANGPNPGDRLMDWLGVYNLYNHCNAAYGGFNDVRQFSPGMQTFMQGWAYGLGIGSSPADVATPGTTGFSELGFVYNKNPDTKNNSGKPYAGTPGNFTEFSCAED